MNTLENHVKNGQLQWTAWEREPFIVHLKPKGFPVEASAVLPVLTERVSWSAKEDVVFDL